MPGWSAWRTSTSTDAPPGIRSPRTGPTTPTPRRDSCAGGWPASCSRPITPGASRSRSGAPRTTSAPAAAPSPTSGTASSPPRWPARPPPCSATPTNPTPTPISPTSVKGLAVLGEHPDAPGEVWHLPNDPDTRTTRQLVETIYRIAGQSRTKLRTVPPLLLRGIALANPTVRELLEMQYQFAEPFIVDSTKIATMLGAYRDPARPRGRRHPRHLPPQRAAAVDDQTRPAALLTRPDVSASTTAGACNARSPVKRPDGNPHSEATRGTHTADAARRDPAGSLRKTAIVAGALYLLTFLTSIPTLLLFVPCGPGLRPRLRPRHGLRSWASCST